jgi:hydroxymethylbilane synthase
MEQLKGRFPDITLDIVVIKTKGDIMKDVSLAKIGGKGLFVKEIEDALLRGEIDMAIHSMKDVPAELPEGLEISITPEREDPRDVLVSRNQQKLRELHNGARIGTGSLRRTFQLRHLLPEVEVVPLRGNLDTRIKKIKTDNLDGVVVAAAGMRRMGWGDLVSEFIPAEVMLPSVGQGVLGIEVRKGDVEIKNILSFLHNFRTWVEVSAERAFLKSLGGGCQVPVAAYAVKKGETLLIRGLVGSPDGREMIRDERCGECKRAEVLGRQLAENILSRGGRAILEQVYRTC